MKGWNDNRKGKRRMAREEKCRNAEKAEQPEQANPFAPKGEGSGNRILPCWVT